MSVQREDIVAFVNAALKRVAAPGVVHAAISGAAAELGWQGLDDIVVKTPASAVKGKKAVKAEDGTEKEKKERKHRPIGPYMLFMSLIMDRINKQPENPAFKVVAKLDENGKPARGGKMTVVSVIWSCMSEEAKATFNNTFKPLCDVLTAETAKSGEKTENVLQRVQDFLASLPAVTRKAIDSSIDNAIVVVAKNKGATPSKAAAPVPDESSDSDSSDSEEPEPVKATPKGKGGEKKVEDKKRKKDDKGAASAKKDKKKAKKEASSSSSSSSEEESDE